MTTHRFETIAERDAWHDEQVPDSVSYLDGSVPGVILTPTDIVCTYLLRVTVNAHACESDDPANHSGPVEVWLADFGADMESHIPLCTFHATEMRDDYDPPVMSVKRAFEQVTP